MFGFGKKKSAGPVESLADGELAMIDAIIVVDHSGSMGWDSKRFAGKTRLQEVQDDVQSIARIAEQHDKDGLTVISFSSAAEVHDEVGSLKVASVFKLFPPSGSTNLTAALKLAVDKATSTKKNTVVIVYTDGSPDDQRSAMKVIDEAGKTLGRPKIGFTFVQVSDDPGAAKFLDTLDSDMKVDVVATVRAEEASKLSYAQLAWLAQNR